jgi:DNA-binding transcriptional regulator of glucitol operon
MEPSSNYTMGYASTGTSVGTSLLGGTIIDNYSSGIKTTQISQAFNLTLQNQIMQNKVAVFHVIRDEDEKIIKTEFIKELWVETKNGQSVDFQVARDSELADYNISELSIRIINTISF